MVKLFAIRTSWYGPSPPAIQSVHALRVNLIFSQTNKQTNKQISKHPNEKQIFFFTKISTWVMCWQISLPGILSLPSGQALITLLGGKTLEYYKNLSICNRIGHSDFFSWWALRIYWVACAQSPATDKMLRTAQNEEKTSIFLTRDFGMRLRQIPIFFQKSEMGGSPNCCTPLWLTCGAFLLYFPKLFNFGALRKNSRKMGDLFFCYSFAPEAISIHSLYSLF